MTFSYNWLQSYFSKKLPRPEKLAQILTMHSFEVKEITKKEDDIIFDIEVTPNRADCFSHLGIAKEISAILKEKIKKDDLKIKKIEKKPTKKFFEIEVENKNDCPRYNAGIIFDLKVSFSPKWLQQRLLALNVMPVNNVVDATNYIMLETGQPLHAFDFDKIEQKIIVRRAKKGEKIHALDDKNYLLDEDILVIADIKEPLAIAGIKGGKKAQINDKTKNILIESANFDPVLIRMASRKLKLRTDASFRFEHGLDPNLTKEALLKAINLIQKIAGGKMIDEIFDYYPKKVDPKILRLNPERVNKVLGIKIPTKKIIQILKSLEIDLVKKEGKVLLFQIPTIRKDIQIEEDLIEEVGRIYGYQKIKLSPPRTILKPAQKEDQLIWTSRARKILKEAGFVEVYNYSFVSQSDKERLNLKNLIELQNPISDQFKYLRPSLLINLLKNVAKNQKYFEQFKIFEIGKVFYYGGSKIIEKRMLSGIIFNDKEGFYLIKGVLDDLFRQFGILDFYFKEYQIKPQILPSNFWHLKKSAQIKASNKEIGFLGEISKRVTIHYEIQKNVFGFEIDFEELANMASWEKEFTPISKYPPLVRDIAILVPLETKVDEVLNVIYEAGNELLRDVDLFDMYLGEELPEGKKNLAFHLIFQSDQKILSNKEVDQIFERIQRAIERQNGWQIRK